MMSERLIIDPVTRIEGHLKVEVEISNGKVVDAWTSGTMARGFEIILQNKDPRDAIIVSQRICGVCPASHAYVSSMALDEAFEAKVPDDGRILRNLAVGAKWLGDHVLHFYHLSALDYIDILAVANYTGNDEQLLTVKEKLVNLVQANDASPLVPRYQPDEFSIKDSEIVTFLVAHYLQALEMRKKAQEMAAIFGGRMPGFSTFVPGGITIHPTIDQIASFRHRLIEFIDFIDKVYLADVVSLATAPNLLLPLAQMPVGVGHGNFLAYGMFPLDPEAKEKLLPGGALFAGNGSNVEEVDPVKIKEDVKFSWYTDDCGGLNPTDGKTVYSLDKADAYSFLKSPRYDGKPMEVGPMARMMVSQDETLAGLISKYNIQVGAVARHVARAVEAKLLAEAMLSWVEELANNIKNGRIDICQDKPVPEEGEGAGLGEGCRGALGHWVKIKKGRIQNYQTVVPTTWNASPRDENGTRGPLEEALIGTPVPDVKNPLNIVRVIRSFDPCLACAVHLIHPKSNETIKHVIG